MRVKTAAEGNDNGKEKSMRRLSRLFGLDGMLAIKSAASIAIAPRYKLQALKKLQAHNSRENALEGLKEPQIWEENFRRLILSANDRLHVDVMEAFYQDPLRQLKTWDTAPAGDLVVGCAVKDDLIRIREFFAHYRALGVNAFIMIDNGSTDGTREYLLQQPDAVVWETDAVYNSRRKTAWLDRAAANLTGGGYWYLTVDSDELFVYPEMDSLSLPEYAARLRRRGITSVKALMLECYPRGELFAPDADPADFIRDYCWFDGDSDEYLYDPLFNTVSGGMHARVFGKSPTRTKVPLVYSEAGRFATGSHTIFPLKENIQSQFGAILLHYKFLPNEKEKIKKIVEQGNYANGSALYKRYLQKIDDDAGFALLFEDSKRWRGAASFQEFPWIRPLTEA